MLRWAVFLPKRAPESTVILKAGQVEYEVYRSTISKHTKIRFVSRWRQWFRLENSGNTHVLAMQQPYNVYRNKMEYFMEQNGVDFEPIVEYAQLHDWDKFEAWRKAHPHWSKRENLNRLKDIATFYDVNALVEKYGVGLEPEPDGPVGSKLINGREAQKLHDWLPTASSSDAKRTYTLLYRASENDYCATKFHRLCDKKGPTYTIIENEAGYVFGGYTEISWESPSSSEGQKDPYRRGFIYLLRSPKMDKSEKWKTKSDQNEVWHNKDWGPLFGSTFVETCNRCHETASNSAYLDNRLENVCSTDDVKLGGSRNFKIVDYEVWRVGNSNECPNT